MKKRNLIVLLSLFLLNSCIVKSLHPFYTKKNLSYQKVFIGEWDNLTNEKGHWNIQSFREVLLKKNKKNKPSELSTDNQKIYNHHKASYLITYTDKDQNKATFSATPFKIDKQLFLDFSPFEFFSECNSLNLLAALHLTGTHSLVKFDIVSDNSIDLNWLDEEKIRELFKSNRIKIKHEKTGPENDILLTASPKELQKFIKKYMKSNDQKKWDNSIGFNLKRNNAKN